MCCEVRTAMFYELSLKYIVFTYLTVIRVQSQCNILRLHFLGRFWWPRGLRCTSAAFRLLGLWVRIPSGARMSVFCECCVLSGRVLCVGLITRPEESYRVWCFVVCDRAASILRTPWPTGAFAPWGKIVLEQRNLKTEADPAPETYCQYIRWEESIRSASSDVIRVHQNLIE
jgi:hypothetical protein